MPSDVADPYAALSPGGRLVAQVCGVVAPHAIHATDIQKLLSQAKIRLLGRRLDRPQIRKAVDELVKAKIVVRESRREVVARLEWAQILTRAAQRDRVLKPVLAAFVAARSVHWPQPIEDETLLRGYLVAGDVDRLDQVLEHGKHGPEAWRFLAEPLAVDLLEKLPRQYLADALHGCLDHVVETAAPPRPVVEACETLAPDLAPYAASIAFIYILQGRFALAEDVFAALPPKAREDKPALVGLAATRALIQTLRGDDAGARRHIEAALAAQRAGTRKRLVFPDLRAFALALVALARNDTPESRAFLAQTLRTADRLGIGRRREIDFVANAARIKAGSGVFSSLPRHPCIDGLFDGLVSCWLDDFRPKPETRLARLLPYRNRAVANGFDWVAAESDEVLRRYADRHGGSTPNPAIGHADLGTTTLATLAAAIPGWEYSLKALEQLAYHASSKPDRKRGTGAPAKRRLAWDLHEEHHVIVAEPREQRENKNGAWSKGRKVALKRLAADAAKMDFLLPQDREAAAAVAIRHSYWSERVEHHLGDRGLYALAGHPYVFNVEGEPVDIVRREPELSIGEDAEGGVMVRIEPHGGDTDDAYRATMATHRRCEVTRFTLDHRRLFSIVPETGLQLPVGAKSRLLEAVSSLAADIRVQSDAADGAASAVQVDADTEPWVCLEPLDAGLCVALVVEPIADSGICFAPGTGGAVVFASRDGKNVQARRDLAAENAAVHLLAGRCPQLSSRPTKLEPLALPEPAQCLEFLERLEAAGVRCKWPQGEPFRIVAHASTPSLALTVKSADQWLQASGKLAVDERRVLDLKRLFELLEANPGSRFLELDDGDFLALTSAFRRQLDDLASLSTPAAKGAVRLNPLAALALDDFVESAQVDADQGWRELRSRLREAESFEPELPSTLQAELRPYQLDGYRWLARLSRWGAGACLADDMGLGKTVQTLALLLARAPDGPALVVAPTSVVANWIDEARRFAPTLNVRAYVGAAASRSELLDAPAPFDLYITTYGVLQNDADQLAYIHWRSAVLDEAQAIKNPATKRARAARRLVADFRLVTTGTPIQNNLMDLFSLFGFLNPGLLGSLEQFRRNFMLPVERDRDADANARLRRLIAPFLLRRLKTEVLDDLPERTEIVLHVEMSAAEATLYEALRRRAVEELEAAQTAGQNVREGVRRVQVLAHLTRLRLACCNPRLVLDEDGKAPPRSAKLDTFATTLEELLENRHKVLVFSQFVMHLKLVEEYLVEAGIAYQYLDGATPAKARAERVKAFQSGQGDVFLISLKAGGIGLNLTAADYVIHMDPWWNPAVEDQASDRAHRIGQTRPVTIYRLVAKGTVEEQLVDLHHRKRDLADALLESADVAGRLNADELLDLLRLPLRSGS